jgi:hypothetical protein
MERDVMRWLAMRGLAVLVVASAACRSTAGGDATAGSEARPPVGTGVEATERVGVEPRRCTPTLPAAPPEGVSKEGPAYVIVDHVGVLKIAEGGVSTVLGRADGSSWNPEVTVGPAGELWVSDWDRVSVLAADGELRVLSRAGDWRPEQLAVRSAAEVWAVTSDSEWSLVRFDGKRWASIRRREQFPGTFEDNQIVALAVTSDAVWVSCWNGLWRGVGDEWRRVEPPEGADEGPELWTYRDRVIAGYHGKHFLRDGEAWRALGWPSDVSLRRGVGEVGLVAAPRLDGATVMLGSVDGEGCTATSEPIAGTRVHALAIDDSARTWLATEQALAVVDASGRVLAEWTTGTLPGLTGRIHAIEVVGAGPRRLPAAAPARTWELVGRMQTHKRSTPLAGATLELCSALVDHDRCAATGFTQTTTTARDGSFRFVGVPEGELHLVVRPPAGLEDCEGIFSGSGHTITPARDCRGSASAPQRCDLGMLNECLPFEMPPPPH